MTTGKKHNTGVYVTEIPHNPVDMLSTIDYETAEDRGYFKLDFLNVSIYEKVKDEDHLKELMNKEPLWELLETKDFCDLVFHVSGHHALIKKLKPRKQRTIGRRIGYHKTSKETSYKTRTGLLSVKKFGQNQKTVNTILRKHMQLHMHMQLLCT